MPEPPETAAIFGGPGSSTLETTADEADKSRNWMGISSFVASAIGLGPVGIVLGHLGLRAVKRRRATNGGMALAGTVVGYVSVVAVVGALVASGMLSQVLPFGPGAVRPSETVTPSAATDTRTLDTSLQTADRWFGLSVGDCVLPFDSSDDPTDLLIKQPQTTPCDQAHYGEVYAIAAIGGDAAPDDATFRRESKEVCEGPLFASYVGIGSYRDSSLYYDVLYPSDRSWENGTHQMVCLLVEEGGTTTGSLRGSGK